MAEPAGTDAMFGEMFGGGLFDSHLGHAGGPFADPEAQRTHLRKRTAPPPATAPQVHHDLAADRSRVAASASAVALQCSPEGNLPGRASIHPAVPGGDGLHTLTVQSDLTSPHRRGDEGIGLGKTRAQTSLGFAKSIGFSDGRERGRLPPRLVHIRHGEHRGRGARYNTAGPGAVGWPGSRPESRQTLSRPGSREGLSRPESRQALPEIVRPAQYEELEQLLHAVSDRLGSVPKQKWIRDIHNDVRPWPTLMNLQASTETLDLDAFVTADQSLKRFQVSADQASFLPAQRDDRKLSRAHSAIPKVRPAAPSTALKPIRQKKPRPSDDLDILSIQQDDHLARRTLTAADVADMPANSEDPHKQVYGPVDLVHKALPSNDPSVRNKLAQWSRGELDHGRPKYTLLPAANVLIKEEEDKLRARMYKAAVLFQANWKRHTQSKRYRLYSTNKRARIAKLLKAIVPLWLRVVRQREHLPGSKVRSTMSWALISWRVEVSQRRIALDKARDLKDLYLALLGRTIMRCWRRCAAVIGQDRRHRMWHGFEPWLAFWKDAKIVEKSFNKHCVAFLYSAFRCLYFYKCCAAKGKRRAHKLFRHEEVSIYEFNMPLENFRGYFSLFDPTYILEKFRCKDWYERRVYRCRYQRMIPSYFSAWEQVATKGLQWRVVIGVHETRVKGRAFSAFCFLLETDEFGVRLHLQVEKEQEEEEAMAELERNPPPEPEPRQRLRDLENDVDNLAGLVDYEKREILRKMIANEKRALMFRVKYDLLSKDRQYVMQLEGETFRDLDALDADIKFITTHDHTRKDEHDQLLAMAKYDETAKWAKCFENVKILFELATDKMASVLDAYEKIREAVVFRTAWRTLRKAAFRVRIKRIFHRAHMRRLLIICTQHRRMERSIYRYRPLRLMFYALLRWFKEVEFQYVHTTKGLKAQTQRRQDVHTKLSHSLYAYRDSLSGSAVMRLPNNAQYHAPQLVLDRWCEYHQSTIARREITLLFHKRRGVHLLSRAFDFLKHGVVCRQRMAGRDAAPQRFLAQQASCDLLQWKKHFFCGVNYANVLRLAERRGRARSLLCVAKGPRLTTSLQDRQRAIRSRIVLEQQLLMRYFESVDVAGAPSMSASIQYPVESWGTVLNMRHSELERLLQRCDDLARAAKFEFGSITVGLGLSNWLFKVECHELPETGSLQLPGSKSYWRHIDGLCASAKRAIAHRNHTGK